MIFLLLYITNKFDNIHEYNNKIHNYYTMCEGWYNIVFHSSTKKTIKKNKEEERKRTEWIDDDGIIIIEEYVVEESIR